MPPPSPERPAAGVAVIEASLPLDSFDFSTADRWHVVVLRDGIPVAQVETPSPGTVDDARLAEALFLAAAPVPGTGEPRTAPPPPSCSLVVCTHRRPEQLADLLDALERLDPAPLEAIVVDNDPGDAGCRGEVEAAGAIYIREDRRGADNARNAGIRAARGELVAFLDDDCIPAAGWLGRLGEHFADPFVAATTGPGFPYRLDTRAQLRIERQASLSRGLERRLFDWRTLPPVSAGAAGVSANLVCRRALLVVNDQPFPPELGPGTPTESGDDTYVFSRILAAGHRILYDPGQFIFHQHRGDWPAVHKAVRGYGVGLSAMLAKALVEDGETEAPWGWGWLLAQYRETQLRRLLGEADAVETRISWDYARGGLAGAAAWRRARREQSALGPLVARKPLPPPRAVVPPEPDRATADGVAVTLILVSELAAADRVAADPAPAQAWPSEVVEVIPVTLAEVESAASRAAGDLIVVLDAALVADRGLIHAHAAAHMGRLDEPVAVGGRVAVETASGRLAALDAALTAHDRDVELRRAGSPGLDALAQRNVSLTRPALAAAGLREGWAARALAAGVEVRYQPAALAIARISTSAAGIADARRAGMWDAWVGRVPEHGRPGRRGRLAARATGLLDGLEWLNQRRGWLAVYRRACRESYVAGYGPGSGRGAGSAPDAAPITREQPEPASPTAPMLRERADGGDEGLLVWTAPGFEAEPGWLALALEAFRAPAVVAVGGAPLEPRTSPSPLRLYDEERLDELIWGPPLAYFVVDAARTEARCSPYALAEELVRDGHLVARRDVVAPAPGSSRAALRARGALLAERALADHRGRPVRRLLALARAVARVLSRSSGRDRTETLVGLLRCALQRR